jgi:hypothetical protein
MCFHSTVGKSKRCSYEHWVIIAKVFVVKSMQGILPWGNNQEKEVSTQKFYLPFWQ